MERAITVRIIVIAVGLTFNLVIDYFIHRLCKLRAHSNFPKPSLVSLALEEQIVDSIPTDSHDW